MNLGFMGGKAGFAPTYRAVSAAPRYSFATYQIKIKLNLTF